ncbi:MAG: imidazolonepropionase [Tissierellia bacterium]|nr:imidazolonepropionase [Tissierellia bacterium]
MNKYIIKNANQIITFKGDEAKKGSEMNDLKIFFDSIILIEDDLIKYIGPKDEAKRKFNLDEYEIIDAKDKVIMPGFVDSHTHLVFGGYRQEEFNMRLAGASYMEIMEAGGGIASTVKATKEATEDELVNKAKKVLDQMLAFGVTTVEAKSGYGLFNDVEEKQLKAVKRLNNEHPIDIISTYMAAHAVPNEYKDNPEEFIDYIIEKGLPMVKSNSYAEFVDIFTEKNVFEIKESEKLLNAAKEQGFKLKIHADEIVQLGGAELAAKVGAISADHLLNASEDGIRKMAKHGVICTLLPMTAFSLKEDYANARFMIDQNASVALASDFNPGSCFSNSIPLLFALAGIYMGMSVEESICALTINGAAAIDKAKEIGTLEAGKKADIIFLDAPDYKFLNYNFGVNLVQRVIKSGKTVYQRNLRV